MIKSLFSCRRISWNKQIIAIASLLAMDKARSSALVKDIITVIYLLDFHAIGLLNRINKYPCVNFLSY